MRTRAGTTYNLSVPQDTAPGADRPSTPDTVVSDGLSSRRSSSADARPRTALLDLPPETLNEVASWLDAPSFRSLALACKQINESLTEMSGAVTLALRASAVRTPEDVRPLMAPHAGNGGSDATPATSPPSIAALHTRVRETPLRSLADRVRTLAQSDTGPLQHYLEQMDAATDSQFAGQALTALANAYQAAPPDEMLRLVAQARQSLGVRDRSAFARLVDRLLATDPSGPLPTSLASIADADPWTAETSRALRAFADQAAAQRPGLYRIMATIAAIELSVRAPAAAPSVADGENLTRSTLLDDLKLQGEQAVQGQPLQVLQSFDDAVRAALARQTRRHHFGAA